MTIADLHTSSLQTCQTDWPLEWQAELDVQLRFDRPHLKLDTERGRKPWMCWFHAEIHGIYRVSIQRENYLRLRGDPSPLWKWHVAAGHETFHGKVATCGSAITEAKAAVAKHLQELAAAAMV